jgi:hypothetical protein
VAVLTATPHWTSKSEVDQWSKAIKDRVPDAELTRADSPVTVLAVTSDRRLIVSIADWNIE